MLIEVAFAVSLVTPKPTNFVVIFCDDLGYGDLSCYGNRAYKTPNLDKLAKEGVRFTDFYAASPACSPSRASLLTGCYPTRVGVPQVLNPDSPTGLNTAETTIPELLKPLGYATACVGKWHLGVNNLMPLAHGFDTFFGLPYSNDMWPPNGKGWPDLKLFQDAKPVGDVAQLEDQAQLTQQYTASATRFIDENKRSPFFLYLAHSMPHVPIAASHRFAGKSGKGPYADTILEIDWSVGEIIKTLRRNGLDRNTLVIFSSDNGPWRPYGDHAGSPGGLREGKGTTFEAGFRVPGIFWQPGTIPSGIVNREVTSTMDVLPTIAAMSKAHLPDHPIDGHDITALLDSKPGAKSPWKWFYYFWPGELQAVRSGHWKLHIPHKHRHQTEPAGTGGKSAGEVTSTIGLSLFNLESDPGETRNVADQHPEVVRRLLRVIEIGRSELGDTLTGAQGSQVRPAEKVLFPK